MQQTHGRSPWRPPPSVCRIQRPPRLVARRRSPRRRGNSCEDALCWREERGYVSARLPPQRLPRNLALSIRVSSAGKKEYREWRAAPVQSTFKAMSGWYAVMRDAYFSSVHFRANSSQADSRSSLPHLLSCCCAHDACLLCRCYGYVYACALWCVCVYGLAYVYAWSYIYLIKCAWIRFEFLFIYA